MMLMQEVQEWVKSGNFLGNYQIHPFLTQFILFLRYGQPPPEIVKEIAPGLELDEDGIPKMDLLNGNEECRIM